MSKKLMFCLFFLFFSIKMVFCSEKYKLEKSLRKKHRTDTNLPRKNVRISPQDRLKLLGNPYSALIPLSKTRNWEVDIKAKRLCPEDLCLLSQQEKNSRFWEATKERNCLNVMKSLLKAKVDQC